MRVEPEKVPDTFRRYPRTLQQAFKQSEGYRQSGWHYPAPSSIVDRVCWGVVIGLAVWLLWYVANAPKGAA